MTIGGVHRQIDALKLSIQRLEAARNGSAFTDKQTDQINAIADTSAKTYSDRVFNRLIIWCAITAFLGGAGVVAAYLKIRGG